MTDANLLDPKQGDKRAQAAAPPAKPPATPPMAAEAPKKPERFTAATPDRFDTSCDFKFPTAAYVPEAGTSLAHLQRPEYWANIKGLKAGVRIFVIAEDEAYFAELLVRKAGQGYAKVQVLRSGELDHPAADPAVASGYEIQFRGVITKHRIVRLSDGHVLKQGLDSEEEAQAWLREHKRMLAA